MKTKYDLYNGKVTLWYHELAGRHQYSIDGHSKLGVTTILNVLNKPALMLWPMNEALRHLDQVFGAEYTPVDKESWTTYREKASKAYLVKSDFGKDVGKKTHELVERYLRAEITNEIDDDMPLATRPFEAFLTWYQANENINALKVEEVIYSLKHDYAGKFDVLLEIDGKPVLADVKTTNASKDAPKGIYAENFLQLGGYSLAYEEMTGKLIDDLMIINCSKEGKVNTLKASEIGLNVGQCQKDFINCLALYRFMQSTLLKIKEK